jgi:hypothetical protein
VEEDFHYAVSFPCELFDLLGSDAWEEHLDQGARYRCLFELATTLLHELVHVLHWERDREINAREGGIRDEPYCKAGDVHIELGEAWQKWFLGGSPWMPFDGWGLNQVSSGVASVSGVTKVPTYAIHWTTREGEQKDFSPWEEDEVWMVKSQSVEEFFDEKRWERFLGMRMYGDDLRWVLHSVGGESPLQLSLAPLKAGGWGLLMDRGVEDNRPAKRRIANVAYDFLLKKCAAGEFTSLPEVSNC